MTASTAHATATSTVTSADGTPIAFTRVGQGSAVILVDGALCHREFGPMGKVAEELRDSFTVYTYDRRGRGRSGDASAYDPAREIEDLAALIEEAGGRAHVCGVSSGAALALEAARRGLPIDRLALYEAPFIVDDSRAPVPGDYVAKQQQAVAAAIPGSTHRTLPGQTHMVKADVLASALTQHFTA